MFIQLILWKDCNNDCSFCSQKTSRDNLTHEDRKKRLIQTTDWIRGMQFNNDKFGLIGGELFCYDGLDDEWAQAASAINDASLECLYLTSNLIGSTHNIIKFIKNIKIPVTVCTSYDTKGRFKDDAMKYAWQENIVKIQKTKASICCTSLMTQEFIEDKTPMPGGMYHNLQEPIVSCEWYYDDTLKNRSYHKNLCDNAPVNLMNRADFLNWAVKHRDYIEHYHNYASTHSEELYEFDGDRIINKYHNRMSMNIAPCGHQYSARCYADSDRCIQCDVEALLM